jgi:hypothetical protein
MIKEFLEAIRKEFPEKKSQIHSIILSPGLYDLQLNIMLGDQFKTIQFTEDELDDMDKLLSEIKTLVNTGE